MNILARAIGTATVLALATGVLLGAQPSASDFFTAPQTLKAPTAAELRPVVQAWLNERNMSAPERTRAESAWNALPPTTQGSEVLDRLATTFARGDPRARALVEACSKPRNGAPLPHVDWLASQDTPPLERSNLRLVYGRWLSHERLYDELLEQLRGLEPTDVVDPAGLLFYQSVAYHRLLDKEEGLRTLDRLLDDVADVPMRYEALAKLMKVDLQGLDEETLDHIARRMDDIRRRLDLGRAGQKVVKIEDDVIKSLDKLIDDLEKKQQQQQQASAGGAGAMRPTTPMSDSQLAPLKGPGEVDRKHIGNTAGWGNLPPKQREEALQQIGKDFPAHYRDAIEQYFRKLAGEGSER
jgi:hypothetical protein